MVAGVCEARLLLARATLPSCVENMVGSALAHSAVDRVLEERVLSGRGRKCVCGGMCVCVRVCVCLVGEWV